MRAVYGKIRQARIRDFTAVSEKPISEAFHAMGLCLAIIGQNEQKFPSISKRCRSNRVDIKGSETSEYAVTESNACACISQAALALARERSGGRCEVTHGLD